MQFTILCHYVFSRRQSVSLVADYASLRLLTIGNEGQAYSTNAASNNKTVVGKEISSLESNWRRKFVVRGPHQLAVVMLVVELSNLLRKKARSYTTKR